MIKKIGIVGCGAMGAGITQVILEVGYGSESGVGPTFRKGIRIGSISCRIELVE